MANQLKGSILNFASISITVGVLGFLSGIVGLFFPELKSIPFKYFILLVWLFLSILIILLKIIFDFRKLKTQSPPFEKPLSYHKEIQSFLIRKNPFFHSQTLVGCYLKENELERLAYLAHVNHTQDKVMHIKILHDFKILNEIPSTSSELSKLEIRPVVPTNEVANYYGGLNG